MLYQLGGMIMLGLMSFAIGLVILREIGWKGLWYVFIAVIILGVFSGMIITAIGMIQFQDFHTIWVT